MLLATSRWALRAVGAALLGTTEVATAVGLIVTEQRGLFGFRESTRATLFWPSLWVDVAGAAVLVALALVALLPAGRAEMNRSAPRYVTTAGGRAGR